MKTFKHILILVIALVTASCNETKKVIDKAENTEPIGTYSVTTIGEVVLSKTADKKAVISFESLDKRVHGNTGCNSFFGSYNLDHSVLTFDAIGQTEMACDEPTMTTEFNFMKALRDTGSFRLQEDILMLFSSKDSSILLTAKKEPKKETKE